MRRAGDPRVVVMAHAIRYGQRREIELMTGVSPGWGVTRRSWSNLFEPAGTASGENRVEHPHP
jgi:hypothetical protein